MLNGTSQMTSICEICEKRGTERNNVGKQLQKTIEFFCFFAIIENIEQINLLLYLYFNVH